jgi:hypothetical protein
MNDSDFERYAEREMIYQVRKAVSKHIRSKCPDGDPMVTGITVMLGTVLAMAVFTEMLGRKGGGRSR